jgi:mono/diheme cytochrome c family protein
LTFVPRAILAFALALAAVLACSAALDHPTEQDVEWASARWPQTTIKDLQRGRALYVEKCAGCHNLPLPEKHSPAEWEGYVAYMVAEARITPEEQDAITRFLTSASARARQAEMSKRK